jgi:hypothetical protein
MMGLAVNTRKRGDRVVIANERIDRAVIARESVFLDRSNLPLDHRVYVIERKIASLPVRDIAFYESQRSL